MKKLFVPLLAATLFMAGCANPASAPSEAEVDSDFQTVIASLGTEEAPAAFAAYDAKYGTTLGKDFAAELAEVGPGARLAKGDSGSGTILQPNMPFTTDGAVYLSGGGDSTVSKVIAWVSPKTFPGGYFHGAVLDLDKFDANNLETESLETAVTKGAGYQSAADWMREVNACVLKPNFVVEAAKLDSAQAALDYYCRDSNTDMEYGFFKNYVNIFNVVTKDDNYTWYCTKVVWRMWKSYGKDIDSNDSRIDFTNSGLYSLVKAYYTALHPFSSSKRNAAINAYIADARSKIVLAEEIMCSPYFTKVYENITAN
jgi:hypothetical protein